MKKNNKQKINKLKQNRIYKSIMNFIDETNFVYLYLFPVLLGIVFMILAILIVNALGQTERTENYRSIILSIGFFIAGFGGLFQIIKKEYFGPFDNTRLTRISSIINGVFLLCFFWGSGVFLLILKIFKIK
jgi:uncharacterized membrane protein